MKDYRAKRLVSIIVPVYNVEDYLAKTIISILDQTYKEFELILVDDGSTDASGTLCDSYAREDRRVRVFHKANSGSSDARNMGLDNARGGCILFVDADDYILPNLVEYMISRMNDGIDIISCTYKLVSDYSQTVPEGSGRSILLTAEEALENMMYQRAITNTPWAKLYNVRLFDSVRFPSGKINQDLGTIYKLIGKAHSVLLVDLKMYMYMYRVGSTINSQFAPRRMSGLQFAKEQLEYIKKNFSDIENAAQDRLFMEAVFILRNMRFADIIHFRKEYKQCRSAIVSTRRPVLVDERSSSHHKVSAIASYAGVWTIVLSGYLIRLIKRIQSTVKRIGK